MKQFSWDNLNKYRSPQVAKFIADFYDKPITEEQFVGFYKSLKEYSQAKKHKGKIYSPSRARKWYRHLVSEFKFFRGK